MDGTQKSIYSSGLLHSKHTNHVGAGASSPTYVVKDVQTHLESDSHVQISI